ncbi:uncharacterized protein EI90DRAFT_1149718 [Cantharellus anzutake]|uniref:uncharacterized protein n=1 Tax=Cantharellus anzutake TaxID=1750568 RepID=UPI001906867D|nr:uncharacterized protein EI90DRAFT_1149718 [Cantharellus anzutake]KAF8310707.1 hypothetical protein EI90DRAFT_1149718 [Cantharellus anzutake]
MSKLCVPHRSPHHSPHHLLCDLPAIFTPLIIVILSSKPTCSWDLRRPHRPRGVIPAKVCSSARFSARFSLHPQYSLGVLFSPTLAMTSASAGLPINNFQGTLRSRHSKSDGWPRQMVMGLPSRAGTGATLHHLPGLLPTGRTPFLLHYEANCYVRHLEGGTHHKVARSPRPIVAETLMNVTNANNITKSEAGVLPTSKTMCVIDLLFQFNHFAGDCSYFPVQIGFNPTGVLRQFIHIR